MGVFKSEFPHKERISYEVTEGMWRDAGENAVGMKEGREIIEQKGLNGVKVGKTE